MLGSSDWLKDETGTQLRLMRYEEAFVASFGKETASSFHESNQKKRHTLSPAGLKVGSIKPPLVLAAVLLPSAEPTGGFCWHEANVVCKRKWIFVTC